MYLFSAAFITGLLLLIWSADRFTDHALHLGQHLRLSKIVVGLVILGFGTSAPELLISGLSAWQGNPGLAIGNALGSNTTNILIILGITLCITPLYVDKGILYRDFLLLIAATALLILLILDQKLQRIDGVILMSALGFTLYLLTHLELKGKGHAPEKYTQDSTHKGPAMLLLGLLFSLGVLLLSSKLVVWSAVSIANYLGTEDLIIGLTIVALGTSLPELATCVASAMKRHSELALGNIIGSNIFNTLGVSGTAGIIMAYSIPKQVYIRDIPIMVVATLALFLLALAFLRTKKIPRALGGLFFVAYCSYMFFIYQQAV